MPSTAFFFTLYTRERQPYLCRTHEIGLLRCSFQSAMQQLPFDLDAVCVLPDHLHCIWTLPDGDTDFATRWRLILSHFARDYRGETYPWEQEYQVRRLEAQQQSHHMDYIHFDPVKHGYCQRSIDWPWSSFHAYVRRGVYDPEWGEHIELA